jgi:hypothetical protein
MTRVRTGDNKRASGELPGEAALRGMYLAVSGYLVLTLFRVHEFFPVLKIIRPLQLLALVIFMLWIRHRPPSTNEPLIRWQLIFLGIMLSGLPIVVNHFWWLNTVVDFIMYFVVFSIGLVTVCHHAVYRQKILRLLLFAFLFLAVWALTHGGTGPPDCWLEDENDIAGVFVVGTCLAYAIRTESPSRTWRWLATLIGTTCVAALIATASRGGFVALVVAVAAIAIFSGRFIRTSIVVALLVSAALPFVPKSYIGEVSSIDDSAESYGKTDGGEMERIYTWRRSWEMFLVNPVIGVGAGNFSWAISRFESTNKARLQRGARRQIAGRAAHSIYFTLLPELGLAGTFAYLMILIKSISRVRNILRIPDTRPEDGSMRTIALFVGPAIIGYSVAGAFISALWYPMLWLLVSLAIALPIPGVTTPDGRQA